MAFLIIIVYLRFPVSVMIIFLLISEYSQMEIWPQHVVFGNTEMKTLRSLYICEINHKGILKYLALDKLYYTYKNMLSLVVAWCISLKWMQGCIFQLCRCPGCCFFLCKKKNTVNLIVLKNLIGVLDQPLSPSSPELLVEQ